VPRTDGLLRLKIETHFAAVRHEDCSGLITRHPRRTQKRNRPARGRAPVVRSVAFNKRPGLASVQIYIGHLLDTAAQKLFVGAPYVRRNSIDLSR
jgi:hypothetical protein